MDYVHMGYIFCHRYSTCVDRNIRGYIQTLLVLGKLSGVFCTHIPLCLGRRCMNCADWTQFIWCLLGAVFNFWIHFRASFSGDSTCLAPEKQDR